MANLLNFSAETGANFIGDDTGSAQIQFGTVASVPTVAVMALSIGSVASAPVFELQNQAFVSATTILTTTGATAGSGAIRVKYGDNYGWIPILPVGSVTAAAR